MGIGTASPQYLLHVNGDAWFSGTVYASGVILTNKLLADTMKAGDMIALNNNLHLTAGGLNEVYTTSGDLRFQSTVGNSNNTIFSAGTNGNVGIGTFNPQYKLDVVGPVRFSNDVFVSRIRALSGDSVIHFGDSTISIWTNTNRISWTPYNAFRGLGIGQSAYSYGDQSIALGKKVLNTTTAINSVTIGTGPTSGSFLVNSIANSFAVGFQSTIPTFFVSSANGVGTVGRVGIGTTTPQADFQIGETFQKICAGGAPGVASTFSTSYVGFNVARRGANDWVTGNDFANNGGTVLLSDVDGGLRIVGIRSTGATDQVITDQNIQDNTKLFIRGDGRVVIGNQTQAGGGFDLPGTLLTVNGNVVCKKMHVTVNSWADSVLAPTYSLMPLDSVDAFIRANGHLPGVPSEEEVKTSGSDLVQTDVILLAKAEELTLYMIQLKAQNAALQERVTELESAEIKPK